MAYYPISHTLKTFLNVTVNNTVKCSLIWNCTAGTIDVYGPTGALDRQLKVDDIADIDTRGKGSCKMLLAFKPPNAPLLDLAPSKSVSESTNPFEAADEEQLAWVGLDSSEPSEDSQTKKKIAAWDRRPLKRLESRLGLSVLKLRLGELDDYKIIVGFLLTARIFEYDFTFKRSIKTLFLFRSPKAFLVPAHHRIDELKQALKPGALEEWKLQHF